MLKLNNHSVVKHYYITTNHLSRSRRTFVKNYTLFLLTVLSFSIPTVLQGSGSQHPDWKTIAKTPSFNSFIGKIFAQQEKLALFDEEGYTLLHRVIMENKWDRLEPILSWGSATEVNAFSKTSLSTTPLEMLVSGGSSQNEKKLLTATKLLLAYGANPSLYKKIRRHPLVLAAEAGLGKIVELLLQGKGKLISPDHIAYAYYWAEQYKDCSKVRKTMKILKEAYINRTNNNTMPSSQEILKRFLEE